MITIKKITVQFKTYPLVHPLTIASGTISEVPQMFVTVVCQSGAKVFTGVGHNAYSLIWADPRSIPLKEKDAELRRAVKRVVKNARGFSFNTPFDFYKKFVLNGATVMPKLSYVMALSPIDLALWDAFARLKRKNVLDLSEVKSYIGSTRARLKYCMHLVGIRDPLDSVKAAIKKEGISAFKIKLKGDPISDAKRINAVSEIRGVRLLTADANEAYGSQEALNKFSGILSLRSRKLLSFVEQPFKRDACIQITRGKRVLPVFADESYACHSDILRLKRLGYSGVSLKPHTKTFSGTLLALRELKKRKMKYAVMDLTTAPPIGGLVGILTGIHLFKVQAIELNGRQYYRGWASLLASGGNVMKEYFAIRGGRIGLDLPDGEGWGVPLEIFEKYAHR